MYHDLQFIMPISLSTISVKNMTGSERWFHNLSFWAGLNEWMQYQGHDSQRATSTSCKNLPNRNLWLKETPNTTPPFFHSPTPVRIAALPPQLRHTAGWATHWAGPVIQHSCWRGGRGHPSGGQYAARISLGCYIMHQSVKFLKYARRPSDNQRRSAKLTPCNKLTYTRMTRTAQTVSA